MLKILRAIKRELFEIIPPTIFFFVAFNVLTYTKRLMLEQYGIKFSGFVGGHGRRFDRGQGRADRG